MEELHYGDKNCSPPGRGRTAQPVNAAIIQILSFAVHAKLFYVNKVSNPPFLSEERAVCCINT